MNPMPENSARATTPAKDHHAEGCDRRFACRREEEAIVFSKTIVWSEGVGCEREALEGIACGALA